MNPNDNRPTPRDTRPLTPQRQYAHTPPSRHPDYQREAATNIIRNQIHGIYSETEQPPESTTAQTQTQPVTPAVNVQSDQAYMQQQELQADTYARTQQPRRSIQQDEWRKYHTAWQEYYKKYYESYYTKHIEEHTKKLDQQNPQADSTAASGIIGSGPREESAAEEAVTRQQAMNQLRRKLLGRVEKQAKRARKSRHFIPAVASGLVVLVFLFLQFNQLLIANVRAYVTPGQIDPQNIIVDPSMDATVSDEPRLIIPKINVDTPVAYDIGIDHESQMRAMEDGVAHFPIPGANSRPGEAGNTVISGHSSNDVFARGDFKFIFMQLDRLEDGDLIYANYEGTRYTYQVSRKEVVLPTEVDKLIYDTEGQSVVTLITCTPLGTDEKRLLVTAELIHPSPDDVSPAPDSDNGSSEDTTIPGQGRPSVIERAFGRS